MSRLAFMIRSFKIFSLVQVFFSVDGSVPFNEVFHHLQVPSFENFFSDDSIGSYLRNPFGEDFIKLEIDQSNFRTNKTKVIMVLVMIMAMMAATIIRISSNWRLIRTVSLLSYYGCIFLDQDLDSLTCWTSIILFLILIIMFSLASTTFPLTFTDSLTCRRWDPRWYHHVLFLSCWLVLVVCPCKTYPCQMALSLY